MLKKGNGHPALCASNLLRTVRGEVPFERLKGLDATLVDKPATTIRPQLMADAEWLLSTYEPRVESNSIDFDSIDPVEGHYGISADIITGGGS